MKFDQRIFDDSNEVKEFKINKDYYPVKRSFKYLDMFKLSDLKSDSTVLNLREINL